MKALVLSTDENAIPGIYQVISGSNLAAETDCVFLSRDNALSGDMYETLQSDCDLSQYELIVLSDKEFDQEVAGAIACNQNIPCVTSCSNVSRFDGGLKFQREVYGGLAHLNLIAEALPLIMTVSCAVFLEDAETPSSVKKLVVQSADARARITSSKEIEKAVDIASAKRIVAVGRGVSKREDLEMIDQFTATLGAELGCSRPLSEDYKWLPLERQVGLTGETVKPQLYLAVGVSGQVQHIAGMRDSKIVVAINNNKSAPIFDSCDYGIVGDLYEIVPYLTEKLSA